MDTAEDIVRSRGYNGFSYADIASVLDVSKAALHHHYPSKVDLGMALIDRFTDAVLGYLHSLNDSTPNHLDRLSAYVAIYDGALDENKMCLCGLMAAEHETLAPEMQEKLSKFFDGHTAWLSDVLENGRRKNELVYNGSVDAHAKLILATLQGALMIAKAKKDFRGLLPTGRTLVEQYAPRAAA